MPWATALVAIAAMGLYVWPGDTPGLQYHRERIEAGELWRFWTAHLLHVSGQQLAWNLGVFALAGAWAERTAARRTRLLYVIGPLVIGVVLLVFDPLRFSFGGLSALGAGAIALLAFTHFGRTAGEARGLWAGVIILLAGKTALELVLGESMFTWFTGPDLRPVPLAEVAGIACAALVHGTRRRFHI